PPENKESGGKRSERLNHVVPAHLERRSQRRTVDGVRDDESTNRSDEDDGETGADSHRSEPNKTQNGKRDAVSQRGNREHTSGAPGKRNSHNVLRPRQRDGRNQRA
ncbi:unnamed protein product, partial [Brassica oleracea]